MRLVWEEGALAELAAAAEWSVHQAAPVVRAMDRMARTDLCLGRQTADGRFRYWPVPPLAVMYRVHGDELIVVAVLDSRRQHRLP